MKLNEIKKLRHTVNEKEVNALLQSGYEIIKIISSKVEVEGKETIRPCYVLANKNG